MSAFLYTRVLMNCLGTILNEHILNCIIRSSQIIQTHKTFFAIYYIIGNLKIQPLF